MKKIIIYSHFNFLTKDVKTIDGDIYDSRIEVYDENRMICYTNKVNVNASTRVGNYTLVELENGIYAGMVGKHRNKYPGILIFQLKCIDKPHHWIDLHGKYIKCRRLTRIDGKEFWYINIHKGGDVWDWSEGCITIHWSDYDKFIKHFKINEKVLIYKTNHQLSTDMLIHFKKH